MYIFHYETGIQTMMSEMRFDTCNCFQLMFYYQKERSEETVNEINWLLSEQFWKYMDVGNPPPGLG